MLVTATLVAMLALPAGANAAGTIVGGPMKVRDYKMTVIGNDRGKNDSVTVMFIRTKGKSSQQHVYSFDKKVKVTGKAISGSLGRYGKIALRLEDARSVKVEKALPKGCTGSRGKAKSGTLAGTFKLVADKTYFRTVKTKKLPATAVTNGTLRCENVGDGGDGGGGGDVAVGPILTHSKVDGGAMFTFSATPKFQTAMQIEDRKATAPAQILHMISASGTGLVVGAGGTTATVNGLPAFLGGQGNFAGTAAGTVSVGTLSGSLLAKFDSIAPVAVTGSATLMNGS